MEVTENGTKIIWLSKGMGRKCRLCGETTKDRAWFYCDVGKFLMCEFCAKGRGCGMDDLNYTKTKKTEHVDWLIDVFNVVE